MIRIENIQKIYAHGSKREVFALKDINLHINKGEIFGVIGLSGAGKSTLIRMINLLERPTSGRIVVDGQELTCLNDKELRQARKGIGIIFQSFNLLSSLTVYDNVAFPLRLANEMSKSEINARVLELLHMVGLDDKADMYPAMLSGGQKQRVGIARALASNPKVLLCDEATSALDPQTTSSILELLMELKEKLGLTIVIITHQMEVIKECCDRVAVIDGGIITEMGKTIEIFTNPQQELTKTLVSVTVKMGIPQILKDTHIMSEYSEGSKAVLQLLFLGPKADSPVIAEVAMQHQVKISIMSGTIDHINKEPFGVMVVEVAGDKETIFKTIAELQERVYKVEVLGYDRR